MITNYSHSPNYKYVYYTIRGPEPQVIRIRLSDRKFEVITGLKGIRRALLAYETELPVAPNGNCPRIAEMHFSSVGVTGRFGNTKSTIRLFRPTEA